MTVVEHNLWFNRIVQYHFLVWQVAFVHIALFPLRPMCFTFTFFPPLTLLSSCPSHSFTRPSKLTLPAFQIPGLLSSPLSLLPLLSCFVLLIPSCSLLLSPTLLLPLLSHPFFSSYPSIFPLSHLILSPLCASPISDCCHCASYFFAPLVALPALGFFFHLASPPPLSWTPATTAPPPTNVTMDQQ